MNYNMDERLGDGAGKLLLTADEVADMLGMRVHWVYEQSRNQLIPTVRLGRYLRYRPEAIQQWLREREC